jgi:hypothetical protein
MGFCFRATHLSTERERCAVREVRLHDARADLSAIVDDAIDGNPGENGDSALPLR